MTSYNTSDKYIEDTVTGTLSRQFSKTEFLLENDKRYWLIFPVYLAEEAKSHIGKQVTIKGKVELYCGNFADWDKHVYETIVREITCL